MASYAGGEYNRNIFTFLLTSCLIFSLVPVLATLYNYMPHSALPGSTTVLPAYVPMLAPKPKESFIASTMVLFAPVIVFLVTSQLSGPMSKERSRVVLLVLSLISASVLFGSFVGSDFEDTLLESLSGSITSLEYVSLCFGVSLSVCVATAFLARSRFLRKFYTVSRLIIIFALVVVAVLQMAAWRVISIASIAGIAGSFDVVAFEVSQMVSGHTVLVDYPSQYGMYPALIAPIMRVIGMSVLKLSLLLGAMQIISMSTLFYCLYRMVRHPVILLAAGLSLVMLTFETVLHVEHLPEYYYQYWPIRFFWPAISVGLFVKLRAPHRIFDSAAMSVLSLIALIWNTDTGLFVVIAYGLYLLFSVIIWFEMGEKPLRCQNLFGPRQILISLLLHIGIVVVGYAAFLFSLEIVAGSAINPRWLIEYPRTFVLLGFMMIAMPSSWHPWISISGIYILGMVVSLNAMRRLPHSFKANTLLYTSMLGIGMLIYYTGRAHNFNLISVCWPSVIVIAILCDEPVRRLRFNGRSASYLILPLTGVATLLFVAGCISYQVPTLAKESRSQYRTRGKGEDPVVRSEVAFIRAHATPHQECLILSLRQGFYYVETGLLSPFKGPGMIETILHSDEDALNRAILKGNLSCIFLGLGPSQPIVGPSLKQALQAYDVAAENEEKTMVLLTPKASVTPP